MENNRFDANSHESSSEGSDGPDKKSKKKSSASEAVSETAGGDKKQKTQRNLAESLDKLPLFERNAKPKAEKPDDSPEAPVEALTQDETKHVQQETAREHLEAIEHVDAETAEELAPAAEFLQRVQEGEDVEEAFAEVAADIGLGEEEIAELTGEAEFDDDEIAEDGIEDGIIDTSEDTEGVVGWTATPSSSGGSAGSPPSPPAPPAAPGGPTPPRPPMGGAPTPAAAAAPNFAPSPNALPNNANVYYRQRNKAGELLLIGLVGYLIGRRKGRLKTEKRLLPVQRKLEKQVTQLEQDITRKEQLLVSAKAQKRQAEARPVVVPAERTQPGRSETRLGMEKPVRAERLGHMVIAAEAPRRTAERLAAEKPNSIRQAFRAESVPDMSRNELLEVSDKIIVEGASLRRIYESRLIGEKQLRHLVSEHLQGKDIRKDLRREMVEREIDFERDPILRDRVRSRLTSSDGGGLGDMLAKAGITTEETDSAFEHRVKADAERDVATAKRKNQRQRVLVDSVLATVIVLLAVVVAILVIGE